MPEKPNNAAGRAIEEKVWNNGKRMVCEVWKARFRHAEPDDRCDIREIDIRVKEFSYDPPFVRGPFVCPNCKGPLDLEYVRNAREFIEAEEREARISVNGQIATARYLREHPGSSIVVHTAADFSDELPAVCDHQ